MLSRQNIWFQVALVIVTFLLLWFLGSGRAEASDLPYNNFSYQGNDIPYFKPGVVEFNGQTSYLIEFKLNNDIYSVVFDKPCYILPYKSYHSNIGNYFRIYYFSLEPNTYKVYRNGSLSYSIDFTNGYPSDGSYYFYSFGSTYNSLSVAFPLNDSYVYNINNNGEYGLFNAFSSYLFSADFEDIKGPIKAIWSQGLADSNYSLRFVQGMVEDNIFRAFWGFPARSDLESYENLPLRVKFNVTNTDTDTVTSFFYPNYIEGFKATEAKFGVKDYELSIPLDLLGDKLPTNYRINYVELYPYYFVNDEVSQENLRSGVKSVIRLNYDGTFNNTVEVQPDDSYSEEDAGTSILGMLSNFFTNFPQMLKSLFVPEAEDIQDLLSRMNSWFSDRFGFIWFPFDFAIQIVDAFAFGESNSTLTVPAFVLNLGSVGTYTIWNEYTFDFDTIGIFEYVRYFNSMCLACSVAVLAIDKFNEWIGGHVSSHGGDFWK